MSNIIQLLQDNVDVEDQGDLCDYLGVHVTPIPGGLRLSQPHLIESILHDLGLTFKSKPLSTPMLSSRILHADLDGDNHDNSFNYRAVLGKLNYLEKSTRPDLAYSVHQCARFLARPKKTHARELVATYWQQDTKGTISVRSHTGALNVLSMLPLLVNGSPICNNKPYPIQTLPRVAQDLSLCWQEFHCFGPASSKRRSHSVQPKPR